MRRIKDNEHTRQVLKNTRPKLRKPIISNCNTDLLNSISECVLNMLNGNVRLSISMNRKLKNHKCNLNSLADKRLPVTAKKRIIQRGGFLLPVLTALLQTS
jgi:hypothetical protein